MIEVAGPSFLDQSLGRFLDELAAGQPAPGGGGAAATAVALGAGLCAMAARLSARQLPDATELAHEADRLRAEVCELPEADAAVYAKVLDASRAAADLDSEQRRAGIARALSAAADVPMRVVEIGRAVAELGAALAESGNPNLRGDAITGVLLAAGGARAAGVLVAINLRDAPGDDRLVAVDWALAAAERSVQRARGSVDRTS